MLEYQATSHQSWEDSHAKLPFYEHLWEEPETRDVQSMLESSYFDVEAVGVERKREITRGPDYRTQPLLLRS